MEEGRRVETGGDPRDEPQANQRLTVAEAAVRLGITEGAVRSRIKRGTLPTIKEGGTVYVVWDGTSEANHTANTGEPSGEPSDQSELVESLQDQVKYLRQQIEAEREAGRRKDHLLAAALERIPAIEPPETRDARETTTEDDGGTETTAGDTGQSRRSWWRRFFGFE